MQPGIQLPAGPFYNMSRDKLEVLIQYLEKNLRKKLIQALLSLAAASVLFVKKPKSSLQFCMNYCGLSTQTIKDKYPLPLIW